MGVCVDQPLGNLGDTPDRYDVDKVKKWPHNEPSQWPSSAFGRRRSVGTCMTRKQRHTQILTSIFPEAHREAEKHRDARQKEGEGERENEHGASSMFAQPRLCRQARARHG